jgi:hypothetical protein
VVTVRSEAESVDPVPSMKRPFAPSLVVVTEVPVTVVLPPPSEWIPIESNPVVSTDPPEIVVTPPVLVATPVALWPSVRIAELVIERLPPDAKPPPGPL